MATVTPGPVVVTQYTRTGALASGSPTPSPSSASDIATVANHRFPAPSILQRAYLRGILYKPKDVLFLIRLFGHAVWSLVRFHCLELPFLLLTGFRSETVHYAKGWNWFFIVGMAMLRTVGPNLRTIGHLRFAGLLIEATLPLQMVLHRRKVRVQKNVQVKVHLETLLRPERACVAQIRKELKEAGFSDDPLNPSPEYLQSMHPLPRALAGTTTMITPLANIPEEVGRLDRDGTFTLKGEWIEALVDPKDSSSKAKSKTVILYLHGGGHAFLSPASHRDFLARLARDVGPGTRVFSVDYRMAPEAPFPAAIHDAFAAFLYLTEPGHEALVLQNGKRSAIHHVPVDPRDVVVGGDSAGGNLAAAFMLYLAKYVQPATTPKYIMPHCALLISAWADPTSSMPSASDKDWHCYCPGPIGSSPYDKNAFMKFKQMSLASNYLIGDCDTVPNPRNALGKERQWQWYHHLAQHPLVSPVHRADVSGLTNTLLHTATHDRLVDEDRLYAHRLGLENPDKIVRIEVYKDMVHVHQIFATLRSARVATKNLARFILRSERSRDQGQEDSTGVKSERSAADGVEWIMVEQSGMEIVGDEGWPLDILARVWPPNAPSKP